MNSASIELFSDATALETPVNAAFSQSDTGGSLAPSTTYYYRVSAFNSAGETLASAETSITTSAVAGDTHTVTVNWGAVTGATGYNVYGRSTGAELFIESVDGQATTTYVDTGAIVPSGALPSANTTIAPGSGQWPGGRGFFTAVATFGGGSVTLQYLGPDNTTWLVAQQPDATDATLAASGGVLFELPPGQIRAAVVTATAVYARADRVPT